MALATHSRHALNCCSDVDGPASVSLRRWRCGNDESPSLARLLASSCPRGFVIEERGCGALPAHPTSAPEGGVWRWASGAAGAGLGVLRNQNGVHDGTGGVLVVSWMSLSSIQHKANPTPPEVKYELGRVRRSIRQLGAPCSARHSHGVAGALLPGFRFVGSNSGCQIQLFWRFAAKRDSQPPREVRRISRRP